MVKKMLKICWFILTKCTNVTDTQTDTHARTHTQTPHDGEGRACRASRGNKVWHCLPKSPFSTSLCTVVWLLVVWSLRPSIKSAVVSLVVLSYVTSLTQLNALQGLLSIHAFSCPVISCPALLRPDIVLRFGLPISFCPAFPCTAFSALPSHVMFYCTLYAWTIWHITIKSVLHF